MNLSCSRALGRWLGLSTTVSLFCLIAAVNTTAQDQEPPPEIRALLEKLFSPDVTKEEMRANVAEAKKNGFSEQLLVESQLLWALRQRDAEVLSELLPKMELWSQNFQPSQAVGIKSAQEMLSMVHYVKAIVARQSGDMETFKKHIMEAFWNNPGSANVYAQEIEKMRQELVIQSLRLDLQVVVTNSEGEATTLEDTLAGKKALLVDFWASWCQPCIALMPELRKKAEQLAKQGVVVVAMNTDQQDAEEKADKVRREKDMVMPWLVEPADRPYSAALEIKSIPCMVLIAPDGKVLFMGHPQSPELWMALAKLDGSIKPES